MGSLLVAQRPVTLPSYGNDASSLEYERAHLEVELPLFASSLFHKWKKKKNLLVPWQKKFNIHVVPIWFEQHIR